MMNELKIHPAVYGVVPLILISIARLPEVIPVLSSLSVGKVAMILAVAGIILGKQYSNKNVLSEKLSKTFIFFFMILTISVTYSIWGSQSLLVFKGRAITVMLITFLVAKSASNMRVLNVYIYALIASAAILAYFTTTLQETGRLSVGKSYDPNDLAMILVTITPFIIVKIFMVKKFIKVVLAITLLASLIGIFLTASRGGFLGLLLVTGYLMLSNLPKANGEFLKKISPMKIALLGVSVLVIVLAAPDETWERLTTLFEVEEDYNVTGNRGRLAIWGRGIEIMLSNPFGVGVGAFTIAEGQLSGLYAASHNIFVQVGAELGFLGLLLFVSILYISFKETQRIENYFLDRYKETKDVKLIDIIAISKGMKAALLGYVFTGFFLSAAYNLLLYVLVGLIISMIKIKANYEKDLSSEKITKLW